MHYLFNKNVTMIIRNRNNNTNKNNCTVCVTTDRSEARVDPLTALIVQGQTGKYQAGVSRAT